MVVSTLYAWLPSYLNRYHGLAVDSAASLTGMVILAGIVGTVGFSYLADRRGARDPRGRLHVPAVLAIVTLVLLTSAFALLDAGPTQIALILAGGLTMTAAVGPIAAVVTDVVHPGQRATAISTVSVMQNLFGLALGPLLTGLLADLYGLGNALAVMPAACGVAALAFWVRLEPLRPGPGCHRHADHPTVTRRQQESDASRRRRPSASPCPAESGARS